MTASPDELADDIGRLLQQQGASIAVAESLTGGLLVQALARTSGSGEWLAGGIVAYATEVKRRLLDVTAPKVVSAECAEQMATGVRERLAADVAVAVTGVGGPDAQDGEPPGTVWIAVDSGSGPRAVLLETEGDPSAICGASVSEALRQVADALRRSTGDASA